MRRGKKILSVLLVLSMIMGMLPMNVLAAEVTGNFTTEDSGTSGETSYLMIATDRHANTTIIGSIIDNIESQLDQQNVLDYLGLGGDMVGSNSSHPAYNSSTVLGEATAATSSLTADNVDIVAGIHDINVTDDAGIVLPYDTTMNGTCEGGAQIYEGSNFYVYGVPESCISGEVEGVDPATEAADFVTWATGADIDTSKVIILVSHYPIHAKRGDNTGAGYWHNALNEVASGSAAGTEVSRNVIFFHGHNHTVDSSEYVYIPGSTMSIQSYVDPSGAAAVDEYDYYEALYDPEKDENASDGVAAAASASTNATASGTDATIYYTYATAGYLNANNDATLVTITDSSINLTKYGTSGTGTEMATVDRVQTSEDAVPQTLIVNSDSAGSRYALGSNTTGIAVAVNDAGNTSYYNADGAVYTASNPYTTDPSTALEWTVTWTSSDETLATVDENGNAIFLGEGEVTFPATYIDGSGYFSYDSDGYDNGDGTTSAKVTWTTDQVQDNKEIALRYFLYLTDSVEGLANSEDDVELEAGTYTTNKYAALRYDNYAGDPVQQEFPVQARSEQFC